MIYKIKKVMLNVFTNIGAILFIIVWFPYLMVKRLFFEIPNEKKQKEAARKKLELAKEQSIHKTWRRFEYWNEEDEKRERLTSQQITGKLNTQLKNTIESELKKHGFEKALHQRNIYRKIMNDIVYEICLYTPAKSQRGLRKLTAQVYPLCFVYQSQGDNAEDDSYYGVVTKECEYEPLFSFDCAVMENLICSVNDMKEIIIDEIIPFFDRFQTLKDLEKMYLVSYKTSELSSLKGYYAPLRNAVFYIGEKRYDAAKMELEQLISSHEKYLNNIEKWLQIYEASLENPKSYYYKNARSDIDYYQKMLSKYKICYKAVQELYTKIDSDVEIQEWYKGHLHLAGIIINKKEFSVYYRE